jgi:hypothetical protein
MTGWDDSLEPSGDAWVATRGNEQRADWAEAAVLAFREACRGEMDETAIYDLVANLGHLCDRLSALYSDFHLDFEGMVDHGRMHYEAEQGPGDDLSQIWEEGLD